MHRSSRATQEAEIRRLKIPGQLRKKKKKKNPQDPISTEKSEVWWREPYQLGQEA
jgi:hypothetical protein